MPVYDIGRFGDRPFFTMKLVKGQTLAAILGERTDPAADRPRLLGIALQVSQAMAYAHAKGVIHRDLKPANIMVGAFGEVQVMDWGLAKVLAEGGVADEERASRAHQDPQETVDIRTARSSGSHGSFGTDTEAGSMLGTPAYMPPEQANGDIAHLDRRADVFGLGAILCEILTGKPPYAGSLGRRSPPQGGQRRSRRCHRPAGCLRRGSGAHRLDQEMPFRPRRSTGPKDAQAVADRLSAYLAGVQERVQVAERERAVAEAKAIEESRRRRVQLALAASLLAFTALGGLSTTYFLQQRAERARLLVERPLTESRSTVTLRDQAIDHPEDVARWQVALAAVKQAEAAGDPKPRPGSLRAATRKSKPGSMPPSATRPCSIAWSTSAGPRPTTRTARSRDHDYADAFRAAGIDLAKLHAGRSGGARSRPARRP